MAKKGYPGLVLVPPSDRTILRRRLLRWSLFIVALIWCASTLPVWPPTSEDRANCRPGVGQKGSDSSAENCDLPQPVPEPTPNQSEFSLTPVSQAEGLSEHQSPPASSTPDPDRLAPQNNHDQDTRLKSASPTDRSSDRKVASSSSEKSASSQSAAKPPKNPDVDQRLAEQGDAFAQYRLGRFYAQQNGKQAPESVRWYKKSSEGLRRLAETGNGQAMYVLGVMYAYGRGVARDREQARRWLAQAVAHKIMAAQPVLASLENQKSGSSNQQTSGEGKR